MKRRTWCLKETAKCRNIGRVAQQAKPKQNTSKTYSFQILVSFCCCVLRSMNQGWKDWHEVRTMRFLLIFHGLFCKPKKQMWSGLVHHPVFPINLQIPSSIAPTGARTHSARKRKFTSHMMGLIHLKASGVWNWQKKTGGKDWACFFWNLLRTQMHVAMMRVARSLSCVCLYQ